MKFAENFRMFRMTACRKIVYAIGAKIDKKLSFEKVKKCVDFPEIGCYYKQADRRK